MHPWHSEQILFFQQQKTIKKKKTYTYIVIKDEKSMHTKQNLHFRYIKIYI